MVLSGGVSYLYVLFRLARLLMRYTVHRGMFHSIPALLIFTGAAFLICGSTNLHLRYFKAGGVFLGVFSHLILDEIYSVQWASGRWRFKSSFGTALKLWGDSAWGNLSTYAKLAIVVVMILSEPMIMERYGQLSPIVVNSEALRDRLRLPLHGAPGDEQVAAAGQFQPPPALDGPVEPTAGAPPEPAPRADRTIYDTARRIWEKFRRK
jgi:hypothetical protein